MTLFEAYKIILTELNSEKKQELGYGMFKQVFPLKSNPNYVVKKFSKEKESINNIQREIKFYEQYPDLYAEIKKVDFEKGYMIQEKLDTDKIYTQLEYIADAARDYYIGEQFDSSWIFYFLIEQFFETDQESLKKFVNFAGLSFLNKLYSFFTKIEEIGYGNGYQMDLSINNIGIDKKGNIKFLDI